MVTIQAPPVSDHCGSDMPQLRAEEEENGDEDVQATTGSHHEQYKGNSPQKEAKRTVASVTAATPAPLVRIPFRVADTAVSSAWDDLAGFCDSGCNVNMVHPRVLIRLQLRGLHVVEQPLSRAQIVGLGSTTDGMGAITHVVRLSGRLYC